MTNLNDPQVIQKIDTQNVLGSVDSLPDQCLHAFEDASKIQVPDDYKNINAVVMCGMGGSGLGARVIQSVFAKDLKVPFIRVNDYNLPGFVNQNTLVFCSSYSGTTEETVQNAQQAIAKKAKWLAITTGNALLDLAKTNNAPYYQMQPKFNPSNQPRMAIGYSVVGQLVLAQKTGLISLEKSQIDAAVAAMKKVQKDLQKAQDLAHLMHNKLVFYLSAEHLVGPLHVVNNQLNENAKSFSADQVIPEFNHHLLEGLINPPSNPQNLLIFLANSNLYSPRIKQRMQITQDIITRNNIPTESYQPQATSPLSQAFELIQFGAYANLYLSILYNQNPAPIPQVDYFKTKLGQ